MEKENTIEFSRGNLVIEIFELTKLQELQKKVNTFTVVGRGICSSSFE